MPWLKVPGDFFDRLALDEMLAPNPANRLHCQHSPTARFESRKRAAHQANLQGVKIWAPIDTSQGWPLTDCLLARHGTARSMSGGGRLCWSFQSGGLMVVSLRRFGLFFSTVLPIWWIAAAIAHVAD